MVVGDDDVDPAPAGLGDLGARWSTRCRRSRSATDRPVSAASTARRLRPWPSSSRLGTYGSTSSPNAPERPDHDRQPGQPVGVEVAEDQDPLAGGARPLEPGQRGGRRRAAGAGRGDPRPTRRNERRQGVDVGDPTSHEEIRDPIREARRAGRRDGTSGVGSTGPGRCQRKRGSITPSGCHDRLHPGLSRPDPVRTPSGGPVGWPRRAGPVSGRRGCARRRGAVPR